MAILLNSNQKSIRVKYRKVGEHFKFTFYLGGRSGEAVSEAHEENHEKR
jgi:hypothetical protein